MSKRISIARALAEQLKTIDGTGDFNSDISSNAYHKLVFWDAAKNFPSVYMALGRETREMGETNGGFWAFLDIDLKVYCKGENAADALEALIDDIEIVLNKNLNLEYEPGKRITDLNINTIVTSQGLLAPYEVGEVAITVRYAIHRDYN